MSETKPTTRPARLSEARFAVAEQKRNIYFVSPEAGTDPDALLDAAFWTHVAAKLRPTDRIEAICEDGTWHQELLVIFAGNVEAKVARLSLTQLSTVDEASMGNSIAEVKWGGPVAKWKVVRKDGQVLKDNIPTKDEAAAYLISLTPKKAA